MWLLNPSSFLLCYLPPPLPPILSRSFCFPLPRPRPRPLADFTLRPFLPSPIPSCLMTPRTSISPMHSWSFRNEKRNDDPRPVPSEATGNFSFGELGFPQTSSPRRRLGGVSPLTVFVLLRIKTVIPRRLLCGTRAETCTEPPSSRASHTLGPGAGAEIRIQLKAREAGFLTLHGTR